MRAQVNLKLFTPAPGSRRTVLLFVFRDRTKTPLARLVEAWDNDLARMWAGIAKPPEYEGTTVDDFFEVSTPLFQPRALRVSRLGPYTRFTVLRVGPTPVLRCLGIQCACSHTSLQLSPLPDTEGYSCHVLRSSMRRCPTSRSVRRTSAPKASFCVGALWKTVCPPFPSNLPLRCRLALEPRTGRQKDALW